MACHALADGRAYAGSVRTDIDDQTIGRFMAELDAATLTRNLGQLSTSVTKSWNALVALSPATELKPVAVTAIGRRRPGFLGINSRCRSERTSSAI